MKTRRTREIVVGAQGRNVVVLADAFERATVVKLDTPPDGQELRWPRTVRSLPVIVRIFSHRDNFARHFMADSDGGSLRSAEASDP